MASVLPAGYNNRCHSLNSHSSHDHHFYATDTIFSIYTLTSLCSYVVSYVCNHFNSIGNETSSEDDEIDFYAAHSYPNDDIIPKGTIYYKLMIKIVDDDRMEDNELIRMAAVPEDLPAGHVHCTTDVIIMDDDGKLIYAKCMSVLLQYSCYMLYM